MTDFLPGDVALHGDNHVAGEIIQWGTKSRFNHARLIVGEHGTTVESLARGAVHGIVHPDDVVVRPPMTLMQREKCRHAGLSLLGTPYGWLDLAVIGLAQVGIDLPPIRKRLARYDRLFCSQLVDLAWQMSGFHAFNDGRLPQAVSPGDIADLAFRSGWELVQ